MGMISFFDILFDSGEVYKDFGGTMEFKFCMNLD